MLRDIQKKTPIVVSLGRQPAALEGVAVPRNALCAASVPQVGLRHDDRRFEHLGACRPFSISRSMPTANAGDLHRSEGAQRGVSSRPFRCYPWMRCSPRRSPSACCETLLKIDPAPQVDLLRLGKPVLFVTNGGQVCFRPAFRRMPTANAGGLDRLGGAASDSSRRDARLGIFGSTRGLGGRRRCAPKGWSKNKTHRP